MQQAFDSVDGNQVEKSSDLSKFKTSLYFLHIYAGNRGNRVPGVHHQRTAANLPDNKQTFDFCVDVCLGCSSYQKIPL